MLKLLLVEDNLDHVELTSRALTKKLRSAEIVTRESGDEALSLLTDQHFDLVILDYVLPGKDGLQVLSEIQDLKPEVPVILVAATGTEHLAVRACELGAAEYMTKSRNYLKALPVCVKRVLETSRLRRLVRDREALHRLLVENANDAIYFHDMEGYFYLLNPKVAEVTGYTQEELLGKHYRTLIPRKWEAVIKARMTDGKLYRRVSNLEIEIRHRDGGVVPVEISITPFEQDGAVIGFHGIARDILERKQAEELLIEHNEKINSMYRELNEKTRRLEEKDRLKDEFVSNISHEFRTPLSGILGYAELLRDEIYGIVNKEQAKALDQIVQCGNHLLDLVNEILDFSKIQSSQLSLHQEPCSPNQLIDAVVSTLKPLVQERGLELRVEVDPEAPLVYADYRRVYQVLLNLAANAVKFTDEGVIEIGVEPESSQTVEFWVRDTGVGIPEGSLDSIFEDFRQGDGSITRKHGGVGLGLSLSRKLVEMHGGGIKVESIVDAGSRFSFTIPTIIT